MICYQEKKLCPKWLIYVLAFFIVSYTFQVFFKNPVFKLPLMVSFVAMFMFYAKEITANLLLVVGVLSIVIIAQGIMFDYDAVSHFTSLFFYVFVPFVLLKILPINYHKYIINIIAILSLISLVCWIAVVAYPPFHEVIRNWAIAFNQNNPQAVSPEQLIFFTYEKARLGGIVRNAGFCHEPGAFSVALIYAMVFNTILTKSYFNRKNLLFVVCLITTFSTAGYLALILFSLNIIWKIKNHLTKWVVTIVLVALSLFAFFSVDFLSDKIVSQYETGFDDKSLNKETVGRFVGLKKTLYVLSKYPLTGRGFNTVSEVKDTKDPEFIKYGFMYYAARVGIIVFAITAVMFYKTIKFWNKLYAPDENVFLKFLPFVVVLFGQVFIPSLLFGMIILETFFRPLAMSDKPLELHSA